MTKAAAILICFISIITSCQSKNNSNDILNSAFEEESANMERITKSSTDAELREISNKRTEPASAYKAEMWFPKAELVKRLSDRMKQQIKAMRSDIQKSAAFRDSLEFKSNQLFDSMSFYKKSILEVDPLIYQEFRNSLVFFNKRIDSISNKKDFYSTCFDGNPKDQVLLLLRHFENNILFVENGLITFCNEQVGAFIERWNSFGALIGQSSNIIRKGERVEITAGIGSFSRAARPRITIDGHNVDLDENAIALYKLPPSKKSGDYDCKVRIDFVDEEGKSQTIEKLVTYKVL